MASIRKVKLKKGPPKVYIIQSYKDEAGITHQSWIQCADEAEAKELLDDVRAAERENRIYEKPQALDTPLPYAAVAPEDVMTVRELVEAYRVHHMHIGGWEAHTAGNAINITTHYIYPFIGNVPIKKVTPYFLQQFYNDLPNHDAVRSHKGGEAAKISARTVREVHKILRPAFRFAVQQGFLSHNPAAELELPKMEKYERAQWSDEEVLNAINKCEDDPELLTMMSMMFGCTLRTGEMLGLTWDCIEFDEDCNGATVYIKNELARLNIEMIKLTGTKINFQFPPMQAGNRTVQVLKLPKTDRSIREVYIRDTLVQLLRDHKEIQQLNKKEYAEVYQDFGLVFCQKNGRPISDEMITKRFKRFIKNATLRKVDLYSLRHSGATAKMAASGNDLKAVQGDMGHSTPDMLMNVYLATVNKARRKVAEQLETIMFSKIKRPQKDRKSDAGNNQPEQRTQTE